MSSGFRLCYIIIGPNDKNHVLLVIYSGNNLFDLFATSRLDPKHVLHLINVSSYWVSQQSTINMWLFKNLRSARNDAGYYNCMIVLIGGSWLLLLPLKGALYHIVYATTSAQLNFLFLNLPTSLRITTTELMKLSVIISH